MAATTVGGGIAGLALAACLDPGRYLVTVHERREGLPSVETSLAMWPEAQRALDEVGILPAIRAAGSGFGGMALVAATPEGTLAQRIWTVPYLTRYARDGAVLVGDAAHGMTPNLGRGACGALIDAVTLADLLNTRPLREALATYSKRRLLHSQALRVASSAMTRLALAEGAQPLRDALLKFAGRSKRATAVER